MLRASAEALGIESICKDLGIEYNGEIWGDAFAALAIVKRKGFGRTRHIDTGLLWVQQVAAEKRLSYHKALGKLNPADMFTKHSKEEQIVEHCERMSS